MKTQYYIKCAHCDKLVELHSEYMVLCPECGRKLSNSYSEWRKKHLEGSVADYHNDVCVSGVAVAGLGEQRKITKNINRGRVFRRLAIAFGTAVVVFFLIVGGMWLFRGTADSSVRAILNSGWKLNYYEDLGATVQFPFVLEAVIDTTFTEIDTATQMTHLVARQWIKPSVCNITAMRIGYVEGAATDREAGTAHIFQSIVSGNKMEAFQYIPSDYSVAGTAARMMSGSYLIEAVMFEFRAVMIVQGDELWYFMVAYPASKPEGTMLADKFFKTIQIQN